MTFAIFNKIAINEKEEEKKKAEKERGQREWEV
jgi:hypothetical protein